MAAIYSVCVKKFSLLQFQPRACVAYHWCQFASGREKSQGMDLSMEVEDFKSALAGPCAAMGDSFFGVLGDHLPHAWRSG